MKRLLHIFSTLLVIVIPVTVTGHVDNVLLPEGCGSCHVGHGMARQPMLPAAEENLCYECHGSEENRARMKAAGKLAEAAQPVDIEHVVRKLYHHPIEEGSGHSPNERIPNPQTTTSNHAECVDCHNPHQRIQTGARQVYDVRGYSLGGQYVEKAVYEYQICLKCHVDINGIDRTGRDMARAFAASVSSQHPVTQPHSGPRSVSLLSTVPSASLMKCSDCHTNNDPDGPRGPHGSDYPHMLSGNYDTTAYAQESPFAFEFCYSCHDRSSILSNESFPLHREHISGNPLKGIRGTSCYTCHAAHSSKKNPHLIEFSREAVGADRNGRLQYMSTGSYSGECYLNCHGHEHAPGRY